MKQLRYVLIALFAIFMSFGFISCNDDIQEWAPDEVTLEVNATNVAGVWKYTYYDYTTTADDYVIMTLSQDGSMTTTYYDVNDEIKTIKSTGEKAQYTGTWSLSGNTLTTKDSSGNTATATIKWVTKTSLYVVLPTDATTGLTDQMMTYTRVE